MAWDAIKLHTEDGLPVSKTDRETILDVAEQVILGSEHDPKYVFRAAQRVSRNLHLIESLRGYAKRAMIAAGDRAARDQKLKDKPVRRREMDQLPDLSHRDDIENRVLIRELLESLPALDREILLRKVSGETGPDIDREMNLKPRTSESRFRAAKTALQQIFFKTPDIDKRSRAR
jgi:hypothetical protein